MFKQPAGLLLDAEKGPSTRMLSVAVRFPGPTAGLFPFSERRPLLRFGHSAERRGEGRKFI